MDSATDNTESSVHETYVRELQAPEAYKERMISIIIRTLCGLRNHLIGTSLKGEHLLYSGQTLMLCSIW